MKKILTRVLMTGMALWMFLACESDDIKYDTSVVKDFQIELNGEPWSLNVGISTLPIFIYKEDGEYLANYSSLYQFALDNGKYSFMATDIPAQMVTKPVNLKDLIVPQAVNADQKVNLSAAMPYESPFSEPLTMNIKTRTGTLRLKSKDIVGDPSYSNIKTTVLVKRNGYKAADETYVKGDMSVFRSKKTTSGGVNYIEDFVVFPTEDAANNVTIKIELLDANNVVVKTKEFAGSFPVVANVVTNVDFNLNDPDSVIKDYVVTVDGVVVP